MYRILYLVSSEEIEPAKNIRTKKLIKIGSTVTDKEGEVTYSDEVR